MSEIKVTEAEEQKPEVRVNLTVYLHAEDMDEAGERVGAIRYVVQEALADEDNDLTAFTYPDVVIAWADQFGNKIEKEQVFHASV